MWKYTKTTMLVFIISLALCLTCSAKTIRSNDGRLCFETPDSWYLVSAPENPYTTDLISIALDNDTFITMNRSKSPIAFREYKDCTYTQKSVFRDEDIRLTTMTAKSDGYSVRVHSAEILDNSIIISYQMFKDGKALVLVQSTVVKDYYCYTLVVSAAAANVTEAAAISNSLTIDGIPYDQWAK